MDGAICGHYRKVRPQGLAASLLAAVGAIGWEYVRQVQLAKDVEGGIPDTVSGALTNTCELYASAVAKQLG